MQQHRCCSNTALTYSYNRSSCLRLLSGHMYDEDDFPYDRRRHGVGQGDVAVLSKRQGYRFVDWVHGSYLLEALEKYGEIDHLTRRFGKPRASLSGGLAKSGKGKAR